MGGKTVNPNLQKAFDDWVQQLETILPLKDGSGERKAAIRKFCLTFVPKDVLYCCGHFNSADSDAFADGLSDDAEFFESFCREIAQCASGARVEAIKGDQRKTALFTLLPPEDLDTEFDIVREIGFISDDGVAWTAEG
jgi:hypothetical protein